MADVTSDLSSSVDDGADIEGRIPEQKERPLFRSGSLMQVFSLLHIQTNQIADGGEGDEGGQETFESDAQVLL